MHLKIDIITVTYNSSKWIEGFLNAFENTLYNKKNIYLTFVDNDSKDDTVKLLENYKNKNLYGNYQVINSGDNLGFGKANNLGVSKTNNQYVLFLNIDTEVHKDAFDQLTKAIIDSNERIAAWEMRQFPYEHPKDYNPVTLEVSWASGACLLVKRDIFEMIGGFDEKIFMYAEDVDLSWNIRANGYKIKYVPKSIVTHYTYSEINEVKPLQFYNSIYNNLMLKYKYGTIFQILKGYLLIFSLFLRPKVLANQNEMFIKLLKSSLIDGMKFRKGLFRQYPKFKPNFLGFDYERARNGAFYENMVNNESSHPLVSIVVRTHKRPEVLREALISLRNQTYKNIEIIVVEDGENTAEQLVKSEFYDLDIFYHSTNVNQGRSKAGNIALSMCKGEYINFLDDDDVFYPEHVEVLVEAIKKNNKYDAVYATSYETKIVVKSQNPYQYKLLSYDNVFKEQFNRFELINRNLFPIQTVLFKRSLYEQYGGFNTKYDYLEDWELWLRYAQNSEFLFVDKLTSQYRVPGTRKVYKDRKRKLEINYKEIQSKYLHQYINKIFPTEKLTFMNQKEVKFYIDEVRNINKKFLFIRGWALLMNEQNEDVDILIGLENYENQYYFTTNKMKRPDVAAHFGNVSGYEYSGFNTYIPIDSFSNIEFKHVKCVVYKDTNYYISDNINWNYTTI